MIPAKEFLHFDHVYMNLPMDAVEFLDVFIGLFKHGNPEIWNENNLPMIHVYGFTMESDKEKAKEFFVSRIGKVFEDCGGFNES
jgi:tRNA G37 N-methylase Trm5